MRSTHSPSLRSRYDYYYTNPPPATTNYFDNQNGSLFGDPVPPSTGFIENLDNHLYGSLRRNSLKKTNNNLLDISGYPRAYPVDSGLDTVRGSSGISSGNSAETRPNVIGESIYNDFNRASTAITNEFRANLDNFRNQSDYSPSKRIFSNEPLYGRRSSNDSRNSSTNEWVNYKASLEEWGSLPRVKHNKNITQINHGSSILPDSRSSSDEKSRSTTGGSRSEGCTITKFNVLPYDSSKSDTKTTSGSVSTSGSESNSSTSRKRDLSPAIITDTITTGSAHRLHPPSGRLHKKPSFTIINELSPNPSRASTPTGRISPFLGRGFKSSSIRASSPNLTQHALEDAMHGENLTKPTVQFSVNGSSSQPRLNSGQSMIPRGILHNKSNKIYDILDHQYENYGKISYLPPRRSRSTTPSRGSRPRSFEMLPFISQIPKSIARTSSMRHSSNDVRFASAGSKPPINPRSNQKGVLRVVSSAQSSPSRIPRRTSIVSSMDGLNRRESSVSPDNFKRALSMPRRGSRNLSPVTKEGNTKSEFVKSPRRILKPTTLSPILGTPNKDSDTNEGQAKVEDKVKSPSKIPLTVITVARLNTKVNSKTNSRDPSPSKSRLSSKSNSRVNSRDPSPSKPKIEKITNVKKVEPKKSRMTPITVSKSLTRTTSKKPAEPTKKDNTLKRTTTIKKSVSSTAVDKTKSSGLKKTSSFRNENPEGAKKEAASTKKEPSTLKKEPSNLKKEPSNLKKETSNLKKEPPIKRENSNLKKDSGNLKRESSSQKIPLSKRKSEENMMKKLEKKNSFKNDKIEEDEKPKEDPENEKFEKLVPMTKNNVVSMTTAAITAQPVQITTTLTNQIPLGKSQSSGHLLKGSGEKTEEEGRASVISDSILEKAQKVEDDAQKTVSDAKNLVKDITSDIKKVESDLTKNVGDELQKAQKKLPAPIEKRDSFKSVNEKSLKKSDTKIDVNNGKKTPVPSKAIEKDTKENKMVAQPPVEADVSVVQNNKEKSDNNVHPNKSDMVEKVSVSSISVPPDVESESGNKNVGMDRKSMEEKPIMAESVVEDDSQPDQAKCSKCCPCIKLPKFCQKKTIESAMKEDIPKSCWNCCKKRSQTPNSGKDRMLKKMTNSVGGTPPPDKDRGKCRLCLDKVFCCRSTNKIDGNMDEMHEVRKCCFCIPCGSKKPAEQIAWSDRRESIVGEPKRNICSRFWRAICCCWCCCKKEDSESRRTSMNSKKQSLAPTIPPEDKGPKLDLSLVDHTSMMKAAIPVLPVCLAYFCMVLNVIVPGLGTIFSGFFCLCIGIPRFSQYDGARARLGSFALNWIIGIAQAFCLLFCLVGWGWSIWWGYIMVKTAKKHKKIRDAEAPPVEEPAPANRTNATQNHRDVEGGRT